MANLETLKRMVAEAKELDDVELNLLYNAIKRIRNERYRSRTLIKRELDGLT